MSLPISKSFLIEGSSETDETDETRELVEIGETPILSDKDQW